MVPNQVLLLRDDNLQGVTLYMFNFSLSVNIGHVAQSGIPGKVPKGWYYRGAHARAPP